MWEGDEEPKNKYIFLFKNKMMLTDKDDRGQEKGVFKHYSTIRVRYLNIFAANYSVL